MYLMIMTFDENLSWKDIENVMFEESDIQSVLWLNANKKSLENNIDRPIIVGSMMNLFGYENRQVALVTIKGKENAIKVADKLKQYYKMNQSDILAMPLLVV